MTNKRIFFTGGSGKAGRHVIPYLLNQGYRVLNVDLLPLQHPGVDNLHADITDSGQMFNAMTSYAGLDELELGAMPSFDAVVHFAAVPRILLKPDNETFRVNTIGTYNVIEAAVKLGIKKIIIASSETTYGVCFSDGKTDPHSLPLEEEYDIDPMDSYGLSKLVNEKTARSFQRRSGFDIYALRIGNVIEPHEYKELFPNYFRHPEVRRRNAFCYIDARDLGQIVDLCIKKDGLGFQVFNAGNDHNGAILPSKDLIDRFFPGVPVTRELGEYEALFSNRKIREVLGFKEQHNWRNYLKWESD
jgi:nucleoside-diphosphate-sugar epimerase